MSCFSSDEHAPFSYFLCSHVIGKRRTFYYKKCLFLKNMGDGRFKVRVSTRRFLNDSESFYIRYVAANRFFGCGEGGF